MKHLRILPTGCPTCRSLSFRYDWSRASNLWRVPLVIAAALIPVPIGSVHLICEACSHRFTSKNQPAAEVSVR